MAFPHGRSSAALQTCCAPTTIGARHFPSKHRGRNLNFLASTVKVGKMDFEQDEENPSGQRNMTEKLNLLLEYQKITTEQNGEWLRQNGLHEEHLNLFQQEIKNLMANKTDEKTVKKDNLSKLMNQLSVSYSK